MATLSELEDSLYKRNQELEANASSTLANIRATLKTIAQGVDAPCLPPDYLATLADAGDELPSTSSADGSTVQRRPSGRASSGQLNKSRPTSSSIPKERISKHDSEPLEVDNHPEASARLNKARAKALEAELLRTRSSMQEQRQELEEARKELKTLRTEKASWSKIEKQMQMQIEKLKKQSAGAEATVAAVEQHTKEAQQEGARADEERRQAQAEARTKAVQLNQALDEVRRYKQQLQEFQTQEREVKDVARADYNKLLADRKRLERQRNELLTAFRKQLKLIDVLKRQKIHMEAARALAFTEEEFMKTLDMGTV